MTEEVVVSRQDDVMRPKMSWSAIFAGTVLALALWGLLNVFGLAAGLTALDPQDPGSARAIGIGTGIWSIIAPLLALFIGGYVAANLANVRGKGSGAEHGAVLWGLCTVLGFVLLGATIGAVAGGTARMGAEIAQAGPEVADTLGITAQDAVEPLNERLREEGKPTVTAAQLRATVQDAASTAVREGELNREVLVASVVRNTELDRQDAEELAGTIETRMGEAGVTQTALRAGERVGQALWIAFAAMLLGLIAAILGGVLGARRTGGESIERRRTEHIPDTGPHIDRGRTTVVTGPTGPTTGPTTTTPSPSGAR
jgi:hypothetical protein